MPITLKELKKLRLLTNQYYSSRHGEQHLQDFGAISNYLGRAVQSWRLHRASVQENLAEAMRLIHEVCDQDSALHEQARVYLESVKPAPPPIEKARPTISMGARGANSNRSGSI